MAYVVWRVFMKKYARIRLGGDRTSAPRLDGDRTSAPRLGGDRNPPVNPADRPAIQIVDNGSSKCGPSAAPDEDRTRDEFSSHQSVRRSSRAAQKVRTYLKKCKDAALGHHTGGGGGVAPQDDAAWEEASRPYETGANVADEKRPATLKRLSQHKSGKEALPNTCWYVADNFETSSDGQVPVVEAVEDPELSPPPEEPPRPQVELDVKFETCKYRHSHHGDAPSQPAAATSMPPPVATSRDVNSCPTREARQDVATLVDRHLGPLYVNYPSSRGVLVRQARDLLVCTYRGNLAAFEREFLLPAAALIAQVCQSRHKETWTAVAPRGWPLSLGPRGISLQLGDLDATLLRHRDCYLCVRPAPAATVELALVWRHRTTLHTAPIAVPHLDALASPLALDMAAAAAMRDPAPAPAPAAPCDTDALSGLLQSLLVSVERVVERVTLDELAFPCPACHAYLLADDEERDTPGEGSDVCACRCACRRASKSDTAVQTSPLFEFEGSIPHIDSDDDEEGYLDNYRKLSQDSGIHTSSSGWTKPAPSEDLPRPKSITELPDKWLLSGIHLPGTHDLQGRPLVLFDTLNVSRACLTQQQVARTILYYASLPSREKMAQGMTVLVVSGPAEEAALQLLDSAFSLLAKHVTISRVLVWRQDKVQKKKNKSGNTFFERSQIQYHVVSEEGELRAFLAEEQIPVTCGGSCSHDQLEWVEFHKELEPFLAQCHACGRRLVDAMTELKVADPAAGHAATSRRQLHHQHRALARALGDADLMRLRREGPATIGRLGERAQWLPASEHVRLALERARGVFAEVYRASRRLEQLSDGRRERLRELARVRALETETEQVLAWLRQKGEDTLKQHAQLATSLTAIKQQEQDFEQFYFVSLRHLDKGGDLLEAAGRAEGGARGSLKDLARSLKQHLRGFSDRLEDTRERLEDTSRCFYLLDKAYEWALEAMKYMSRVGAVDEVQTPEQALQMLKQLQQYLMAHPAPPDEHLAEMAQLAARLCNERLSEQARVAAARCHETGEALRSQQARLVQMRRVFGGEEEGGCQRPTSPKGWRTAATSTPAGEVGRRRSVGSVPYVYRCSHHAAGHACSCWDPTPPDQCCCGGGGSARQQQQHNLGNIAEVRESVEDLLDSDPAAAAAADRVKSAVKCGRCGGGGDVPLRQQLRRSCTWQYPTENYDDEEEDNSRLSGSTGDDNKCEYSTDNSGDTATEGSDGCAKSGDNGDDLDDSDMGGGKCVPPVSVNSHLHCNAFNLDLSNSSAEPGSKEQKTHRTLLYIMREMIQTERDYVKSLEYIIENYIPELLREDIPQALRGQRNVIFGNVEKIYEFHSQYFLRELEKCEHSPLLIGQSFLTHEKKFYLYALYNKNKPKSDGIMSEYGTTFFKSKQLELGDRMDLASYLLKPVQRMGKYALLLQQLVKAASDKAASDKAASDKAALDKSTSDRSGSDRLAEQDVSDMKSADKMVRFQLRHGNDLLAMDSLRDCDINVKEQGRLLRQNEFLVWQGKGKKCLRHVFLFEDLILFSKARRFPDRKNLDLYIYKNSIKMTDIGLTAKIGDSPTKFEIWFRKRKTHDTFTLQTMSEDVKQAWTEEISKLLWQQALRNRESRLAEMSSMGIGNKPCLDIRPSEDQISDRSISIAQLSKTAPRFRNSITVVSADPTRTNKRPHSIISVSSSSSSGGSSTSQSSAYGALINLGFDPADSPRLHHRSATLNSQCSMESGIIADISLGSEDTDGSGTHWCVERSDSTATTASADSSLSPLSPLEESKPIVADAHNEFYNIKL